MSVNVKKAWYDMFSQQISPAFEEISQYINNDLWEEINQYIQNTYKVSPKIVYSNCSQQKGWNVKYQKGGKALCTLYPMDGYYIALIVIGNKELTETELIMPSCSDYVQKLFAETQYSAMGRWLMISVTNTRILNDVKNLMEIRVKSK